MPASGRTLRDWLLPRAEEDEKFRLEVQKSSLLGLRLLSAHAIAIPPLLWLARFQLIPNPTGPLASIFPPAGIVMLGALGLAAGQVRWTRRHARFAAALLSWLIAAVLVWFVLFETVHVQTAEHRLPGYICLLMLVTVIAVPLKPVHALSLSLSIELWYAACAFGAGDQDLSEQLFLVLMAFLSALLAAAVYAQRVAHHRMREQALRANEYLCLAQSRVLLSENAASLGRLAATLVHELNSPLGALGSAVDTMMVVSSKQATAAPEAQERLLTLQADLRNSIRASLERLAKTAGRIERLTALDETEFQSVDVNELLRDVAGLIETHPKNKTAIEFDTRPLPALTCQPQQLSAVFSNVLTNAAKAMNGSGRICIATRQTGSHIEIRIQDFGCGVSNEDLAHIFEPGFKVAGGRMSTGNWSLFSCRQIIHGHGGEMYMTSSEGKGSTVVITLPF